MEHGGHVGSLPNTVIRMLKAPEIMECGEHLKELEKFNLEKRELVIISTHIAFTSDFLHMRSLNLQTAL